MTFVTATVLYLLVSRLAIVSAGVVNMVIGYRLFCRGIATTATSGPGSTIESSVAGVNFSVKNAAPGTAFALFGAILISVMLIESSPSVTWESVSKWQTASGSQAPGETAEKLQLRGDSQNAGSLVSLTNLGRELESRGKTAEAERAYQEAVTAMAEPMNDLAWVYLNSSRAKQALGLATLAVELRPDEPRYADTLAKVRAATVALH
jgi:tetratricopeptide (TPR) repeat protein